MDKGYPDSLIPQAHTHIMLTTNYPKKKKNPLAIPFDSPLSFTKNTKKMEF